MPQLFPEICKIEDEIYINQFILHIRILFYEEENQQYVKFNIH